MDYLHAGIRASKTVNGTKHTYVYASGKLLRETFGDTTIDFFYSTSGQAYALTYNGTTYHYITNLQGDVMQIVNANGEVVAEYEYDPYGNIISATGELAEVNPLRYRGYVYDQECDLYYLQSRYYDSKVGRFINADVYVSTGQGILGNNMFAYCLNNPVMMCDLGGYRAVINTRTMDGYVEPGPIYYSDGQGKSDDLLESFRSNYDVPSKYENFTFSVYALGRQFKKTDHSVDQANFVLGELCAFVVGYACPLAGVAIGAYSFVTDFLCIDDVIHFPDGYYDTYRITISWKESHKQDSGTTYTYYSYEFIVCWNTIDSEIPYWQVSNVTDNTKVKVVGN